MIWCVLNALWRTVIYCGGWRRWARGRSPCLRTVGCRCQQALLSCATWEVTQFPEVSQQTGKIRKNRETDRYEQDNEHAVSSYSKRETFSVARDSGWSCGASCFMLHWGPNKKFIWSFINRSYLASVCLLVSQNSFNRNSFILPTKGELVPCSPSLFPLLLLVFHARLLRSPGRNEIAFLQSY